MRSSKKVCEQGYTDLENIHEQGYTDLENIQSSTGEVNQYGTDSFSTSCHPPETRDTSSMNAVNQDFKNQGNFNYYAYHGRNNYAQPTHPTFVQFPVNPPLGAKKKKGLSNKMMFFILLGIISIITVAVVSYIFIAERIRQRNLMLEHLDKKKAELEEEYKKLIQPKSKDPKPDDDLVIRKEMNELGKVYSNLRNDNIKKDVGPGVENIKQPIARAEGKNNLIKAVHAAHANSHQYYKPVKCKAKKPIGYEAFKKSLKRSLEETLDKKSEQNRSEDDCEESANSESVVSPGLGESKSTYTEKANSFQLRNEMAKDDYSRKDYLNTRLVVGEFKNECKGTLKRIPCDNYF